MSGDNHGQEAVNGTSRSYTNGKPLPQTSGSGTANGTHKPVASGNGSPKARTPDTYQGHDREEVTRILIQALSEMGYHSAAQSVTQDSGTELESPTVAAFRRAVLDGSWNEAEELLLANDRRGPDNSGLVLVDGADRSLMRFWIRQQKFLELLEQRDTGRALSVLRNELTPLYHDMQKLQFLSSLIMCQSADDLRSKADWDGVDGESRRILLSELSKCICPAVMLPEHRLAGLLHQAKQSQVSTCTWHTDATPPSLYSDHKCDRRQFPKEDVIELDEHGGEVWQVVFSHDGTKLASCGSDKQVIIWEVPSFRVLHYLKDHDAGVGNVSWSWDDSKLVTCCQDKYARLWDVDTGKCIKKLERFSEPVSSCVWAPDGGSFITSSLDKVHSLVQWDSMGERMVDWASPHRVEDVAISPDGQWLIAMDDETHIHAYDFTTREFMWKMDLKARCTSVAISQNSRHLLVNHKHGVAQLIDVIMREPVQEYTGHLGGDFIIRSSLGGANENFVISGSDDGMINIWHKASAMPVERLEGHMPRCNSVSWNPTDHCMFASCGDDGKVKIWSNNDWRRNHMESYRLGEPARSTAIPQL